MMYFPIKQAYIMRVLLYLMCFWMTASSAQQSDDSVDQFCGVNQPASQLAHLIINHPSQNRSTLKCDELLMSIAQQRAEQLANNTADLNTTPNQILIQGGFRIPNYYPVIGNQVEAQARDINQADQVIKYFIESGKHHDHVFGKGEFFGLQSQLGVGFFKAKDATQHDQWVVLSSASWKSPKIVFKAQTVEAPFKKETESCDKDWKKINDKLLKEKCRIKATRGHKSAVNKILSWH